MQPHQEEALSFPELMNRRQTDKIEYYDEAHMSLVADYVTMAKRNNGDYMGVIRSKVRNQWLGVLNKGFFTYPVISRSIRSKTATAVSTQVQLDVSSALQTPDKKAAAELAQNLSRYFEEHYWTERVETMIAMLGQIGRFAAILTEPDPENGMNVAYRDKTAPGWLQTSDDMIGCYACGATYSPDQLELSAITAQAPEENPANIDAAGENQLAIADRAAAPDETDQARAAEMPADDFPPMPASNDYDISGARCINPNCTESNLGIYETAKYERGDVPTGEKEAVKAAKIKQTVISPLLIRYDDLHTIGFDWQKSHWMNYHPLESKYEIIAGHKEIADHISAGNWNAWSDSARWYYELSRADGNINTPARFQHNAYDELVEANYWFYQPITLHGWTEPVGWELVKNGKVVFSIKQGETIEQACKRSFKTDKFRGLMVKMVGSQITDVKNISFLDCLTLFGWTLSVTSHVPAGDERLIQLQDAATRVFSMVYSCVQRLSVPKGWADGRVWNREDLLDQQPGKWIMTKQDVNNDDIPTGGANNTIGYIQAPNPSNIVEFFISLIIQIAKEESGVFDETVGANNSQNQTAAGRATALNQSLNLMTPTQKAKKEGKIAWLRLMLKLWQSMPDEAFSLIKGTYEEEWKAADIEAFKSIDVDHELVIKAVEGTDVPKTRPQQLVNFQIAGEMGLLAPNPMIEPELQQYILKNVLGIDFDMNNTEADRRLAARRLEAMHEMLDQAAKEMNLGYDQMIEIVIDPVTQIPTRKLHADILMSFAQDIRIKPRQEDNHAAFIGYYVDQLKGVTGSREPRETDVLILENALDMHYQLIAQKAATERMANDVANGAGGDPNAAPATDEPNQPKKESATA